MNQNYSQKKRKRNDGSEICIIHFAESDNGKFTSISSLSDPQARLDDLKRIKRLRGMQSRASQRLDQIGNEIPSDSSVLLDSHGYHRDCYKKFTHNMNRLAATSPIPPESDARPTRSTQKNVIFEPDCIFCNIADKIHVNKSGIRTTESTSTFDFGGGSNVQKEAENKNDQKLLLRIRDIDLFAAEAKYHPSCRKKYFDRKRPENTSASKAKQSEMENAHNYALQGVIETIKLEVIINQQILKLTSLNTIYKTSLADTKFSNPKYRAEKLKRKLLKHDISNFIGISSVMGSGRCNLVYSSALSLDSAIRLAFDIGASATVSHAASQLRNSILTTYEKSKEMPWPPPMEYLEKADVLPDDLSSFLHVLFKHSEKIGTSSELRISSIGQDICRAVTQGRWKLPKHLLLCETFRHLFRSKELITMMNKLGHSENYSFALEMETAYARQLSLRSEVTSEAIVIKPEGKFVFHSEFDNFDQFVNDSSGAGSVHTAHGIMLQDLSTENEEKTPDFLTIEKNKIRSLNIEPNDSFPECYVSNSNRSSPKLVVNHFHYPEGEAVFRDSQKMNLLWILLRSCDVPLPGWSGFVSLTGEKPKQLTIIGYYPVLYKPITEYSTIQQCLKLAEKASDEVGQNYVITTFDLGVCMKAYPLVWNYPSNYERHIILLGTFHLTCAYMHMIGKKMKGSGLSDILLESGLIGSGSIEGVLSGKNYARAMNCYKVLVEALGRLKLERFLEENCEKEVFSALPQCSKTKLTEARLHPTKENITILLEDPSVSEYLESYLIFTENISNGHLGETAQFWSSFEQHIWLILQLHEAVKRNNFHLYAYCLHLMPDLFFSFGGQNYARYTTMFSVMISNIDETHPGAKNLLENGAFSVARSMIPGCRTDVDRTMEETFMKHAKSRGGAGSPGFGINGITRNYAAYQRWVKTTHLRSTMLKTTLKMIGGKTSYHEKHKDFRPSEMSRLEKNVGKAVCAFKSFINPYDVCEKGLFVLSSGAPVPEDISKDILMAEKIGRDLKNDFIEKRLLRNENFFEPLKKANLKTMDNVQKTVKLSTKDNKIIQFKQQGHILSQLLVKSQEQNLKLDLAELMKFCLTPIPYSLATGDGFLAKTDKSKTYALLTKKVENFNANTTPSNESHEMLTIEDGNALFYAMKQLPPTFYDICLQLYGLVSKNGDVIFSTDMYVNSSIKSLERRRRGISDKFIVAGPKTRKPKDWKSFLTNDDNKNQLTKVILEVWSSESIATKLDDRKLIFIEKGTAFLINSSEQSNRTVIEELYSNQEETDSRVIVYCRYAEKNNYKTVKIRSPDTDVFWILLAHANTINCTLLFDHGYGNNRQLINVSQLAGQYGQEKCEALLSFHAFTGCDSCSSFKGRGKVGPLKKLLDPKNSNFVPLFQKLGINWQVDEETIAGLEKFTCLMYGSTKCASVDELRHTMMMKKCNGQETNLQKYVNLDFSNFPPNRTSLLEHIKRANYQTKIWRDASNPISEAPLPWNGHGWTETGEPLWCPVEFVLPSSMTEILAENLFESEVEDNGGDLDSNDNNDVDDSDYDDEDDDCSDDDDDYDDDYNDDDDDYDDDDDNYDDDDDY